MQGGVLSRQRGSSLDLIPRRSSSARKSSGSSSDGLIGFQSARFRDSGRGGGRPALRVNCAGWRESRREGGNPRSVHAATPGYANQVLFVTSSRTYLRPSPQRAQRWRRARRMERRCQELATASATAGTASQAASSGTAPLAIQGTTTHVTIFVPPQRHQPSTMPYDLHSVFSGPKRVKKIKPYQ
eukprot:6199669-Pleurochrysis_carterae.AAC.6